MLREIRITPVLNGWIVRIGCQKVVFDDLAKMTKEIGEYFVNPDRAEKRYRAEAVNAAFMSFDEVARQDGQEMPATVEVATEWN